MSGLSVLPKNLVDFEPRYKAIFNYANVYSDSHVTLCNSSISVYIHDIVGVISKTSYEK